MRRVILLAAVVAAGPAWADDWTLITVNGATVEHSRGYATLRMCEEAKSLALYGKTIDDYQNISIEIKRSYTNRKEAWYKFHPPRAATAQDQAYIKDMEHIFGEANRAVSSATGPRSCGNKAQGNEDICIGWHVVSGGLIQDDPIWIGEPEYPKAIDAAECVIEPHPSTSR